MPLICLWKHWFCFMWFVDIVMCLKSSNSCIGYVCEVMRSSNQHCCEFSKSRFVWMSRMLVFIICGNEFLVFAFLEICVFMKVADSRACCFCENMDYVFLWMLDIVICLKSSNYIFVKPWTHHINIVVNLRDCGLYESRRCSFLRFLKIVSVGFV